VVLELAASTIWLFVVRIVGIRADADLQ